MGGGGPARGVTAAFRVGWSRFGSFSAAGRGVRPVDPFGFSWLLAVLLRRPPLMSVGFPWISLDSLVRIETFQWVTRILARRIFPRAFSAGTEAPEREPHGRGMRKRRIVHGPSLTQFLIFCNRLSSATLPLGRLNPNAARSRCAGANAAKPKSGLAIDLTASLSRPPSYWNEYFATPR